MSITPDNWTTFNIQHFHSQSASGDHKNVHRQD